MKYNEASRVDEDKPCRGWALIARLHRELMLSSGFEELSERDEAGDSVERSRSSPLTLLDGNSKLSEADWRVRDILLYGNAALGGQNALSEECKSSLCLR